VQSTVHIRLVEEDGR